MFVLGIVFIFCLWAAAFWINSVVQQNYNKQLDRKRAIQEINELIYENYRQAELDESEYNQNIDDEYDLTPREEFPKDSNIISFLKEKNSRKYRK